MNGTSTQLVRWSYNQSASTVFPGTWSAKLTASGSTLTVSYKIDNGSWVTPVSLADTQITAIGRPGLGSIPTGTSAANAWQIDSFSATGT